VARSDAVQFFLELAAEWRRLGAEVTFEPGWERRGNGMSPAYEGGIVHHTAFISSFANPFPAHSTLLNGRAGLPGPLCNVAGPVCPADKPRLHIMAAFPSNNAGASGGKSMGPLPKTSLFNRLVVGLEIDYSGFAPMIGGQYQAALIFTRGLANVLKRSVEYIRAHAETSITGKWDIGAGTGKAQTYDMAKFRRDAVNLTPGSPASNPLPLGESDMRFLRTPDGTIWKANDFFVRPEGRLEKANALAKGNGVTKWTDVTREELLEAKADADEVFGLLLAGVAKASGGNADAIIAGLLPKLVETLSNLPGGGLTSEDVEQAVRDVFADASS
jgi:hypothetical protein